MKKSLVVRAVAALAASTAVVARASEGAPEMQMEGVKPLLIIVGGVTIMGIVVWLGLRYMNKK